MRILCLKRRPDLANQRAERTALAKLDSNGDIAWMDTHPEEKATLFSTMAGRADDVAVATAVDRSFSQPMPTATGEPRHQHLGREWGRWAAL